MNSASELSTCHYTYLPICYFLILIFPFLIIYSNRLTKRNVQNHQKSLSGHQSYTSPDHYFIMLLRLIYTNVAIDSFRNEWYWYIINLSSILTILLFKVEKEVVLFFSGTRKYHSVPITVLGMSNNIANCSKSHGRKWKFRTFIEDYSY